MRWHPSLSEARDILTKGVTRPNIGLALMQAAQEIGGVDDLPILERDEVAWMRQALI